MTTLVANPYIHLGPQARLLWRCGVPEALVILHSQIHVTDYSRDRVFFSFSGKHTGRRKEEEDRRKYIEGEIYKETSIE